ncbi:unnamed protein product, partial [Symbiodinium pilosum]
GPGERCCGLLSGPVPEGYPRDKYQKKVLEFWIEHGTVGEHEKEEGEELWENTYGEGTASSFTTGGVETDDLPGMMGGGNDDMDDESDAESTDTKQSSKAKRKQKAPAKDEVEEERALEASQG